MNLFSLTLVAVLAATAAPLADRNPTETDGVLWEVRSERRPNTPDSQLVLAMTSEPGPGVMRVRCTDDGPEVLVSWNEYLGSDNTAVVIRATGSVETAEWLPSAGWSALIAPDPMDLLERLVAAGGLTLDILPFRGGSAQVSIAAGDLASHLPRLAECD